MPIIKSTQALDVPCLKGLIYGDAGSGKTSLISANPRTLILDFDVGAHRAIGRDDVMRMDSWLEVVKTIEDPAEMANYDNIVFDTVATALDMLMLDLIRRNPKYGNASGGLSVQGWGALSMEFTQLANKIIAQRKNLIMVAHAKEEKEEDRRYYRPHIPGSSKDFISRISDFIGYAYTPQKDVYVLDFSCPEKAIVKDAGGLGKIIVPNLVLPENRAFFGGLLSAITKAIATKSKAQEQAVNQILEFKERVQKFTTLKQFNAELIPIMELLAKDKGLAVQFKTISDAAAMAKSVVYNKTTKAYEKLPAKLQEPSDDKKAESAEVEAIEATHAMEQLEEEDYQW